MGLSTTAIFSFFGDHILGNFKDKASVIIEYHADPRRLFSDPKCTDGRQLSSYHLHSLCQISSIPDYEANTCSSEFYVRPGLSLLVLFITTIMLAMNNDDDRN